MGFTSTQEHRNRIEYVIPTCKGPTDSNLQIQIALEREFAGIFYGSSNNEN